MNAPFHLLRRPAALLFASLCPLPAAAQAPTAAPATAPMVVRTALPLPIPGSDAVEAPGRTEPVESVRIFTRATGIVHERRFDIGDRVAAGDVMVRIDVPDLDRAVAAAEAQIELAKVRLQLAQLEAARATELVQSRVLADDELQRRTAEVASWAATLRGAEAEAARLHVQQGFATVAAPFAGVIAARNCDRGDRVRGDTAGPEGWLYELVRLDELRFVVPAAPELALRLTDASLPTVHFREFPGRSFAATALRRSGVFDAGTGTMRVELRLANPDLQLPAGLSGTARCTLPPLTGGFLVPGNALQLRAGQPTLAIVRDGRIVLLPVATGRTRGLQVEVAHAELSTTTSVVINPNALLRPGDVVQIAETTNR